ncbi:MAG: FecR domain-containing protein [Tannerellaceae bacterium]|nr:FecR domain-containing protein [Tannerellaceae bacterium]
MGNIHPPLSEKNTMSDIQRKIFEHARVIKKMRAQWEEVSQEKKLSATTKARMLGRIEEYLWYPEPIPFLTFYKVYSVAATVLLLLAISAAFYLSVTTQEKENLYVVSSGIQNIEFVRLPDGTDIQLGPNSRITYPQEFRGAERMVTLEGQAFFNVTENPQKPFIVVSKKMHIRVLGTAFEVFSYDSDSRSEVILLQGSVQVDTPGKESGDIVSTLLTPDEKFVFNHQSNTFSTEKVNADTYTLWRKQRILGFENEPLSMIIPRLENWYGRNIICQKDLAEKYRFTFKVRGEPLEQILFMISESSPLIYTRIDTGDYRLDLKK